MDLWSKARIFMPVPSLVASFVAILYFRRPSSFSASSENYIPFYLILKNTLFLLKLEFLKEALTDIKSLFLSFVDYP